MRSLRLKTILCMFGLLLWSACSSDDQLINGGSSPGQSEISGVISGSLELRNSPYHVIENLIVASNTALSIEPGVKLFFDDSTMFIVQGALNSIGDSMNSVEFTSFGNQWWGIKFVGSNLDSKMSFCIIENVFLDKQDSLFNCAVEVLRTSLTIENCILRNNRSFLGGGVYSEEASVTITNSIFRDNVAVTFGGAMLFNESRSTIINNTVFQNQCFNHGGGLVLIEPISADIQNNIFAENSGTAGDPRISLLSGDSTNFSEQFNFLGFAGLGPRFAAESDLHLRGDSPAIDAGNPDPIFNDVDGSRNDQGAYGGPGGNW